MLPSNEPLTELQRADRLHELACQIKALQFILDGILQEHEERDVCFGVFLLFQTVIEGLDGLSP